MVFWPPLPMVYRAPYPWYIYIKPLFHGILNSLSMVYLTSYSWYIEPPIHSILKPLPMVFWPLYTWYFDPSIHGISTPTHGKDVQSSRSLAMFLPGSSKSSTDDITQSVINGETLFQGFIIEHNLPLATECTILRPSEKNSISSLFYHTIFKVLTTQILYPKCSRMQHFASF